MATVKEFKEWLNRFPDDTIVELVIQEGPVMFKELKLEDSDCGNGWEYTDFNGNKFVKPDSEHYGKRYLWLGERN